MLERREETPQGRSDREHPAIMATLMMIMMAKTPRQDNGEETRGHLPVDRSPQRTVMVSVMAVFVLQQQTLFLIVRSSSLSSSLRPYIMTVFLLRHPPLVVFPLLSVSILLLFLADVEVSSALPSPSPHILPLTSFVIISPLLFRLFSPLVYRVI